MANNLIPLDVQVGALKPAPSGETRQQFANELAARLLVYLPSSNSTFVIGGSQPTSDEGPWFKEVTDPKTGNSGYELWVWSVDAATYKPLTLNQSQLRYFVGSAAPDQTVYDVWVSVDTNGKITGIFTYNSATNAWEVYAYTVAEIDSFFEPTVAGKKQVLWDNVISQPAHVSNAPRAVSGIPTPLYNWEQVYHTDCGGMLIYDSNAGQWKTLGGIIGDVIEVSGTSLGTTADFAAGVFTTILGKHPGWELDTPSSGRTVVGANPSEVWDTTTTAKKEPGTTHGADQNTIARANLPNETLDVGIKYRQSINGGGAPTNGLVTSDNTTDPTGDIIEQTEALGSGQAITNVQKSIAYYRLRKTV